MAYAHGHHESVLRSHAARSVADSAAYLIPHLRPGVRILDVGAGPGTITVDLADRVQPGQVVGVDASPDVVARAESIAGERGNLAFRVGDAYALDEPDGSFDVVHAHQVLQHLERPVAALREFRRVAGPDGLVAARDVDYGGVIWYPRLPELDEWITIYLAVHRGVSGEPDAGRRLKHWARQAGFTSVTSSASVWLLRDRGQAGVVGRHVGRPRRVVRLRRARRAPGCGRRGDARADLGGLAHVGGRPGRLDPPAARRDHRDRLSTATAPARLQRHGET